MLTITITKGVPASGKSTWAKEMVSKDPLNWFRINNDSLRAMANNSVFSKDYEQIISSIREFSIISALKADKNVIVDNVNMSKHLWNNICATAYKAGKDVLVVEKTFYVELEDAIERDSKRPDSEKVGADVIKHWWDKSGGKKFKDYVPKSEMIYGKTITPVVQDPNLEHVYVVDIDGTCADISHRTSPYSTEECLDDMPIVNVIETVVALYEKGYKIIFVSGRGNEFRGLTETWLNRYVLSGGQPIKYELLMRPESDTRPDNIIKQELFEKHIKDKYFVVAAFDDRLRVIRMWRGLGITVFQLNEREF